MNKKTLFSALLLIILAAGALYYWYVTTPSLEHDQVFTMPSVNTPSAFPFQVKFKGFDISLESKDQTVTKIGSPYCGGEEGDNQYRGTYEIVAKQNGKIISSYSLGPQEFTEHQSSDGIHLVTWQPTGENFLLINQYGGCNGEEASFFTINSSNQIVNIPFVDKNTTSQSIWNSGGPSWRNPSVANTFCAYSNVIVMTYCDTYKYQNYSFIQTDSWVVEGPADPTKLKAPTDVDRAERYLLDWMDSTEAKSYFPSDTWYPDQIRGEATTSLPYRFKVDLMGKGDNDYQYIIEVNKTSTGLGIVGTPTKIK